MKQQKKQKTGGTSQDSPKKQGDKLNPQPGQSQAQRQGQRQGQQGQQGQQQGQQGQQGQPGHSGQLGRPDEPGTSGQKSAQKSAQVDTGREHLESGDTPE